MNSNSSVVQESVKRQISDREPRIRKSRITRTNSETRNKTQIWVMKCTVRIALVAAGTHAAQTAVATATAVSYSEASRGRPRRESKE